MSQSNKKPATVLAIFISIINAYKKTYIIALVFVFNNYTLLLKHILCIHYLIWFKKNQAKIQALLDFGSEINVITPAYAAKLSLKVQLINVGV